MHPAAGAIVFAAPTEVPTDVPSIVLFALGASVAGSLHATRATVRPASTTMTAGAGNPVLSLAEDVASAVLSVVAVFAPVLGVICCCSRWSSSRCCGGGGLRRAAAGGADLR